MKQVTPFVISEFTNPSGKIVFQLYARLDGQRFRKNFQTRAEAEAERQVQEVSWLQRDTGTRAAVTRLNEDQLHEAEAAFLFTYAPDCAPRSQLAHHAEPHPAALQAAAPSRPSAFPASHLP